MERTGLVNRVGPWVVGDQFWDREDEVAGLIDLLDAGENVLLVAPRRIGKTSILRETLRRLEIRNRDYGLFVDVEHCSTPEEVLVAVAMATRPLQGLWTKTVNVFRNTLGDLFKSIESVGYDTIQIKFREGVEGDWTVKGERIFEELARADRPVILCLDELPVMLIRLLRMHDPSGSDEGRKRAEVLLAWMRMIA